MKPIAKVGLLSPIAPFVLCTAIASAQDGPGTAAAAGAPSAPSAPSKDSIGSSEGSPGATAPASKLNSSTPSSAPKSDAAGAATPLAAAVVAEGQVATSQEEAGGAQDQGDKDMPEQDEKAKQASGEKGGLVGDSVGGDPWTDSVGVFSAVGLSFRFLFQPQYQQTFGIHPSNPDETYRVPEDALARNGDGWDIHRAFFGVGAQPSKYLHLRIITDFAELRHNNPKKAIKQAYVELRPLPKHLHFLAGIMKLPLSIHELDSAAAYEFTSYGQANSVLNDLGFAGRDIGAEMMVAPLSKQRYLKLTAGAFRGHANDENASPIGAIGGRLESEPMKGLRFGASVVSHPKTVVNLNALETGGKDLLPNPDNPAYPRSRTWKKGQVFSGDITFRQSGFMLRGEGLIGTRVDHDTRYDAEQWAAVWGIAAYKFKVGPVKLEPAVRVEFLDTDFEHDGGLYRQLSFGMGTHFNSSAKVIVDVTRMDVQDDSPIVDQPRPLREIPYHALSSTRVTGRLQIAL